MGTHPIFESDFDCLTDRTGPNLPIMTEQMTFKGSLKGHNGWVTQIATTPIFPDMLLSSSRDKTIIMWHLTREEGSYGVPKRRMQGHSHFVSDVEVSSDGQYALSGSWDATLRLWDLASGNTVRRFVGHTKDVLSVSFSPDNRQILSAARDRTIKLWNTVGVCKFTIQENCHTEWVSCVRFSPLPAAETARPSSGTLDPRRPSPFTPSRLVTRSTLLPSLPTDTGSVLPLAASSRSGISSRRTSSMSSNPRS